MTRERIAFRQFQTHRSGAKKRGIAWHFTFEQWWSIWESSGHWEQRGRGTGTYVMCRNGDLGPYAVGNVFIALNAENVSFAQKLSSLPIGVVAAGPSFEARRWVDGKFKYLGVYPTPERAREAYLAGLNLAPVRELPRGVYRSGAKFYASRMIRRVAQYLGTFETIEEAHAAYKNSSAIKCAT